MAYLSSSQLQREDEARPLSLLLAFVMASWRRFRVAASAAAAAVSPPLPRQLVEQASSFSLRFVVAIASRMLLAALLCYLCDRLYRLDRISWRCQHLFFSLVMTGADAVVADDEAAAADAVVVAVEAAITKETCRCCRGKSL